MTEKAKETVKLTMGTFLQLGSILVIIVLSFSLVKSQADENTRNHTKHEVLDEKRWDSAFIKIEKNEEDISDVQVQNSRIESNQREILRRLDENKASNEKAYSDMMNFMQNFEVK